MAGPGGKEVGRVSVRVVPDTDGFRERVKEEIEKKLKDGVKVPVGLDDAGIAAKAKKIADDINKKFRATKIDFDASGVTRFEAALIRTHVRVARMYAAIQKVSKSIRDATKRVLDMRSHWQSIRTLISRSATGVVTFGKRVLNIRSHLSRVAAGFRALPGLIKKVSTVGLYKGFVGLGNAAIRMKDGVVNGFKGLKNGVAGAISAIQGGFKSLGTGISGAIKGMTSMGRVFWMFIGIVALIAPGLALIGSLLSGLPSILAAAGAGFAAIALGMDGIKKAATDAGLSKSVDALKKSLSDTFAKGLTPVFKQLNTIFPTLQAGLNKVAEGLIPMAQAFTNVVTSAAGMKQIEQILAKTGEFFKAISPMVTNLTAGFLNLATSGAQNFGILAEVLNRFGAQFNLMTQRMSGGAMTAAMGGLAKVVDALLQSFLRLWEVGFNAMAQLGGPLATMLTGFTDLIVGMMPALTAISAMLATFIGELGTGLGQVFTAITPAITLLAQTLGTLLSGALQALMPIILAVAQILNAVFLAALQAIQPIIPPLVAFFTQLGTILGDFLLQALTMLTPLLNMAAQFLTQVLMAVTPLLPVILQLAQALLGALMTAIQPLIPVIMELAATVFPMLVQAAMALVPGIIAIVQAIIPLIPAFAQIVAAIIGAVVPAMMAILEVVQAVWPAVLSIIQGAVSVITGLIRLIVAVVTGDWRGAWEAAKTIVSGAWQMIKGAVQAGIQLVIGLVRTLPGAILSALGNLGSLLFNAGKAILQGLWNGMKAMWNAVAGWVGGLASKIAALKGPLPYDKKLLIPAGKAIMGGLNKGLVNGFREVSSTVSGMAGSIASAFDDQQYTVAIAPEVGDVSHLGANSVMTGAMSMTHGVELSGISDQIAEAFEKVKIEMDGRQVAKGVNKTNTRNGRR